MLLSHLFPFQVTTCVINYLTVQSWLPCCTVSFFFLLKRFSTPNRHISFLSSFTSFHSDLLLITYHISENLQQRDFSATCPRAASAALWFRRYCWRWWAQLVTSCPAPEWCSPSPWWDTSLGGGQAQTSLQSSRRWYSSALTQLFSALRGPGNSHLVLDLIS